MSFEEIFKKYALAWEDEEAFILDLSYSEAPKLLEECKQQVKEAIEKCITLNDRQREFLKNELGL